MPSRVRHIVEPLMGWLFVLVVVVSVGAVILAATRPRMPGHASGPDRIGQRR